MQTPKAFFVVSRYNEDIGWLDDYTSNYVVYNKGHPLTEDVSDAMYHKQLLCENIGGNQKDILDYIYTHYESLPELIAFMQANPFDHCKKETFDRLIYNEKFTPLEDYSDAAMNAISCLDKSGGFVEANNSWYIGAHNSTHKQSCKYVSFDHFMFSYFTDYSHLDWIRFAPGSQYIVEKAQILKYPRSFWLRLSEELVSKTPTEGHIIERAMMMIFTGNFKERT